MNRPERQLQPVVPSCPTDVAPVPRAAPLTVVRAAPPGERRVQLEGELDFYVSRLAELDKLDPYDFTGLKHVYGEHVRRTRALLADCDG